MRHYLAFIYMFVAVIGGATPPAIPDTVHLHDVVVTARQDFKDVIPAQTLRGRELEGLRSQSVADALRYFSGVQLKDYGGVGGIKTVNIRSMGTNHMGVYYNGVELGNAQNGQIDLGKYSMDNVEAISLYNGQRSNVFQSAREFGDAGSIYITTRIPRFEPGKTSNMRAGVRTGSFGYFNPHLALDYRLSNSLSATFSTEWVTASGKYKFRYRRVTPSGELAYDTTATRQNGDIDAVRFEGGLNGSISGKGYWKAYIYHYTSERGVPGAIVNNVWRRGERLWDRNSFAQASGEYRFSRLYSLRVNLKYAYDYTRYVNNDDKLVKVDNVYKQKELYFSAASRFEILRNWEVSAAWDIQWNGLSEYMDVDRTTQWASVATAFSAGDVLRLQASLMGTFVAEEKRDRESAPDKSKITPAVFASLKPLRAHNLVLRAFYKQSYRMPTFNDLYYTDMGNAFLKPETAIQYNAGILYDIEPEDSPLLYLRIGADVYYNDVRDKIVAYPKGQQFRWTMLNLGRVDIRGVDAQLWTTFRLPADIRLTTKLQYTYQKAIDVTNPADNYYRHQIPYIPWHSGSAVLMAEWRGWYLSYSYIYTGERYNQQENIRYNYTQPWYTSDIAINKTWRIGNVNLKGTAEINNIFNQDYDVIINYPMPKRNFRFGISVEL